MTRHSRQIVAVAAAVLAAQCPAALPFGQWTDRTHQPEHGPAAGLFVQSDLSTFTVHDPATLAPRFVVRDGHQPAGFTPDGRQLLMHRFGGSFALLDLETGRARPVTPPGIAATETFINANGNTLLTLTADPDIATTSRLVVQRFDLSTPAAQPGTDLAAIEPIALPLLELHRTLPGRQPNTALLVLRDLELTGDPYDPRRWGDYQFVELDLDSGRTSHLSVLTPPTADLFFQDALNWTSPTRELLHVANYPDFAYTLIDPYAGNVTRVLQVPGVQFNTDDPDVVTAIRTVEKDGVTQLFRDYLEPGTLRTLRNVPISSAEDFPEIPAPVLPEGYTLITPPGPQAIAQREADAGSLIRLDTTTGEVTTTYDGAANTLYRFSDIAFHPTRPEFFANDYNGNVTFFRFTASGLKAQRRGSSATSLLYTPDGESILATEAFEGPIRSIPVATVPYDADATYDYPQLNNTLPEYDAGFTVSPAGTWFIAQTSTLSTLYHFGDTAIAAELFYSPRDQPDFYAFSSDETLLARLTRRIGYNEDTGEEDNFAELNLLDVAQLPTEGGVWSAERWSRPLDHGAYALAAVQPSGEIVLLNQQDATLESYTDAGSAPRRVPLGGVTPDDFDPWQARTWFDASTQRLFFRLRASLGVVDLDAAAPTVTTFPLEADVDRFHRLGDGRHLVVELSNGALVFVDATAPTVAISATLEFYNLGDDYLLRTPAGRFDATPALQHTGSLLNGYVPVPLAQIFNQAYDPELFTRLFSGLPTEVAPLADVVRPPTVTLDAGWISALRYKLRLGAESTVQDIAELRLYQNDKLIHTTPPSWARGAGIDLEVELLIEPQNTFRLVAVTTEGLESLPAELVLTPPAAELRRAAAAQRPAELHLLVVGVNEYRNPEYNLNFAVPDASGIRAKLETVNAPLFATINTHFLADAEATHDGILAAFAAVKTAAQPHDAFLFYFAGHGVMSKTDGRFYLIPHDVTRIYGESQSLSANGLSADTLRELSAGIAAQKQLFILDACNSGGALQAFAQRGASQEKALAQLARATGTHWIAASSANQFATEFAELGHGAFTHTLLQALDGRADTGDKRITINELKAYLEAELPTVTQRYKGAPQYPSSYGYGQDFPVALLP